MHKRRPEALFGHPSERSVSPFRAAPRALRALQAHSSLRTHQLPSRHPQIRQREQRDELRGVVRQPAVANLGEAELPLDHCFISGSRSPSVFLVELGAEISVRTPAPVAVARTQFPASMSRCRITGRTNQREVPVEDGIPSW